MINHFQPQNPGKQVIQFNLENAEAYVQPQNKIHIDDFLKRTPESVKID